MVSAPSASRCAMNRSKIVKWYGTNTDIDDRKRKEEELQRSEAFSPEAQRLSRR